MKRLYLLVALIAVLGYVGWRAGVVRWPQAAADRRRRGRGADGGGPAAVSTCRSSSPPTRNADVPVTLDAIGTVQALNTVTVRRRSTAS